MFGLFKPRIPAGPHGVTGSLEIERPAAAVFPLIDPTDPRYAKRQLGERLEAVEGREGVYRLVMAAMPELTFELELTEREPGVSVGFECRATPPIGRLAAMHELYRLEPLGENACRLELVNTVTFDSPLRTAAAREETGRLAIAVHNALAKIKLHAEHGPEAVRAADAQLVVGVA